MRQSQTMSPSAFAAVLGMQARATQQRRSLAHARLAWREAEAQSNGQAFDALHAALVAQGPQDPAKAEFVVLPSGPSLSGAVPRERRRRYLRHLIDIIQQAFRQRSQDGEVPAAGSESEQTVSEDVAYGLISGQLCAVCRGGCCTRGQEHGFLQPESIQRLLLRHPDYSVRQILRTYLEFLPKVSMEGGCINQTEQGCHLPRDLRSSACNRYMCSAMTTTVRREQQAPALQIAVVVQRQLDHWQHLEATQHNPIVATALIRTEGFVRLPPPT